MQKMTNNNQKKKKTNKKCTGVLKKKIKNQKRVIKYTQSIMYIVYVFNKNNWKPLEF